MSTKQQTTSSQQQSATQAGSSQGGFQNIFDPASMARYQQAQAGGLAGFMDFANNPLQSMFFQNMLGMGQKQIGLQGQSNMQSFLQNLRTAGMSGSSPFAMAQTAQMGRFNSGQQANMFNQLLQQGVNTRLQALGALQGFGPLQTGGKQNQSYTGSQTGRQTGQQTQTMSGLGTWLPQLIGGGLSALTGGLMGGGIPTSRGGGSMNFGSMPSPTSSMGGIGSLQNPFMNNVGGAGGFGLSGSGDYSVPNLMGQPAMPSGFSGFSSPGGG